MSAPEYVGDTGFKSADIKPQLSPEDWLQRARQDFTMSRAAIAFLNSDDEQLERRVHSLADRTKKPPVEVAVELMGGFNDWAERYEAGGKVARAAAARMVVIAERLCGRETMERTYRT